ncbi:membrane hypothetical protein [Frankia sp. AiPs1]
MLAAAAVTIGGVVLARALWLLVPVLLPPRLRFLSPHPHLSGRELVALSWSGMRGVISLAAVFALPLTTDAVGFPHRDLLLFCAYSTVLLTLVVQGLTFGPLLRRLGVRPDAHESQRERARARAAAAEAGLRALRSLQEREPIPDLLAERLGRAAEDRKQRSEDSLKALNIPADDQISPESPTDIFGRVRRAMIEAERYIRDTTWQEDSCQTHTGNGPRNLAALRNLALSLLRIHGVTKIREMVESIGRDRHRALKYLAT